MKTKRVVHTVLAELLILAVYQLSSASTTPVGQASSALVTGQIMLNSIGLPRAKVELVDRSGKAAAATDTGPTGVFNLASIPFGSWILRITPEFGYSREYKVEVDSSFVKVDPINIPTKKYRVTTQPFGPEFDSLRIRSGPGTQFPEVAAIPNNAVVLQIGPSKRNGETIWIPVEYRTKDGKLVRGYSTASGLIPQ